MSLRTPPLIRSSVLSMMTIEEKNDETLVYEEMQQTVKAKVNVLQEKLEAQDTSDESSDMNIRANFLIYNTKQAITLAVSSVARGGGL